MLSEICHSLFLGCIFCVFTCLQSFGAEEPRVFTDSKGRTFEARAIGAEPGFVVVQRASDSKEFKLSLDTLSRQDRSYVASYARRLTVETVNKLEGRLRTLDEPDGNIVEIDLSQTQARDSDLITIGCIATLERIALNDCSQITDEGIGSLANHPSIKVLELKGCNRISDSGFSRLSKLKSLQELHLSDSSDSIGAGLQWCKKSPKLTGLTIVDIGPNKDDLLKVVSELSNLRSLSLINSANLVDEDLSILKALRNLNRLDLSRTGITDAGLRELHELTWLKAVNIYGNKTTPAGFERLREALGLAQNALSDVYGTAYLNPTRSAGTAVKDAVALRYKCRVVENQCTKPGMWKIVFLFNNVHGPEKPRSHVVQNQISDGWLEYSHMALKPPHNKIHFGEASFSTSVPDNHRMGNLTARTLSQKLFPCQDSEVDYIEGYWARSFVAQADMTQKDIHFELERGEVTSNEFTGWKVRGSLPDGKYRTWRSTITFSGNSHQIEYAFPKDESEYLKSPFVSIATEAFVLHPGYFEVVLWDFEFRRENSSKWEPLNTWELVSTDPTFAELVDTDPFSGRWGMRKTHIEWSPAIEVSNSFMNSYLTQGEKIDLTP